MNNDHETKKTAIVASAAEQIKGLLESNFDAIHRAANDSFVDDEQKTEPRAKVGVQIEWDTVSLAPKVSVRISWSARFKDESEADLDPLQAKLGLEAKQ